MNTKFNVYIYIYVLFYSHCYTITSFIYEYLYKGYASYIYITREYVKHKRLRTTALENTTFQKLNLFLSSGEGGEHLLSQLGPLESTCSNNAYCVAYLY
jgi:hypothetical protein